MGGMGGVKLGEGGSVFDAVGAALGTRSGGGHAAPRLLVTASVRDASCSFNKLPSPSAIRTNA